MTVKTCQTCFFAFNDTAGEAVKPLFVSAFRGTLLDQGLIVEVNATICHRCLRDQNLSALRSLEPYRESLNQANAIEREQAGFVEMERRKAHARRERQQEEFLARRREFEAREEPQPDLDRIYRDIFANTTDTPARRSRPRERV